MPWDHAIADPITRGAICSPFDRDAEVLTEGKTWVLYYRDDYEKRYFGEVFRDEPQVLLRSAAASVAYPNNWLQGADGDRTVIWTTYSRRSGVTHPPYIYRIEPDTFTVRAEIPLPDLLGNAPDPDGVGGDSDVLYYTQMVGGGPGVQGQKIWRIDARTYRTISTHTLPIDITTGIGGDAEYCWLIRFLGPEGELRHAHITGFDERFAVIADAPLPDYGVSGRELPIAVGGTRTRIYYASSQALYILDPARPSNGVFYTLVSRFPLRTMGPTSVTGIGGI